MKWRAQDEGQEKEESQPPKLRAWAGGGGTLLRYKGGTIKLANLIGEAEIQIPLDRHTNRWLGVLGVTDVDHVHGLGTRLYWAAGNVRPGVGALWYSIGKDELDEDLSMAGPELILEVTFDDSRKEAQSITSLAGFYWEIEDIVTIRHQGNGGAAWRVGSSIERPSHWLGPVVVTGTHLHSTRAGRSSWSAPPQNRSIRRATVCQHGRAATPPSPLVSRTGVYAKERERTREHSRALGNRKRLKRLARYLAIPHRLPVPSNQHSNPVPATKFEGP